MQENPGALISRRLPGFREATMKTSFVLRSMAKVVKVNRFTLLSHYTHSHKYF